MKIKMLLLTVILGCATATLFADEGWGSGYDDGSRDGDWTHRDYGYNQANPALRQRFLNANPGVKKFIDEKNAAGATVLNADLERDWTRGISGEVVVSEKNGVIVYYVDTKTGTVITQHAAGWGW